MRDWHAPILEARAHGGEISAGQPGQSNVHHDALEFPDGKTVLLTNLCKGQVATVLQLPVRAGVGASDDQPYKSTAVADTVAQAN
jgi:hypothetical protein